MAPCVNMPLSPPAFEAICEIGIFTAASLHIERLHVAAPACLLYKQHQLASASVHVHSAPACCTCGTYMHLQSPLYRNPIHSSNQHSKVIMHILVLPHTSLTLRICTCAGRRCELAMSCPHSVFRLHTSMLMHTAMKSTKYRASSTQAAPARCCCFIVRLRILQRYKRDYYILL